METKSLKNFDDRDSYLEDLAHLVHDVNKEICETLGDYSQPSWYSLPLRTVKSIYNGIEFLENNPSSDNVASHENWCKFMKLHGWKYGPVKDSKKKEHPCLVPYEDLPNEQKIKDAVFRGIVKFWLEMYTHSKRGN